MNLIRAADIGCDDKTWAMIEAARSGDVAKMQALLQEDPNLCKAEYWYTQPIHFAVREGHLEAVKLLMDAGADPTIVRHAGDPLPMVARDRGHYEVARLLEEAIVRMGVGAEEHEIHAAASAGDLTRVQQLLEADPALVRLGDSEGRTPLHGAVPTGRLDLVEYLLDRGADVNAVQAFGNTYSAYRFQPIDLALWRNVYWSQRNDYAMARYLIARGASYSITIAAALGDLARVKELLDRNADLIREAQPCGKRPLSAAAERGYIEIVKLLLERGADPNLPEGMTANKGTALYAACCQNNLELAEVLLAHGADPNSSVDSSGNCLFKASTAEMKRLLYLHGAKPMEAFSYIWQDNIDVVAVMAHHDPAMVGRSGCGGAFAAVCKQGRRDWLQMLLKLGVRVPAVVTGCRSYLWTHPDMTRVLLEHGMNPDLPDWQHATPLHNICGRDGRARPDANRLELADLFLEFGADINAMDEEYRSTPLGWAARNNLPDMVELLLKRGADPNAAGAPWAKPRAWAERRRHDPIIDLLNRHIMRIG